MRINIVREPFNHIIIENMYSHEEYQTIWNELMFLKNFMGGPSSTRSARGKDLKFSKKGDGIFLQDFFTNFHEHSSIFQVTRKLFSPEIMSIAQSIDYYYKLYQHIKYDAILLQYYRNGDFYKKHMDTATFSAVTLLHKEPKKYEGGELSFTEYNYTPNIQNNSCIIFPSHIFHEVKEVYMNPKNLNDDASERFTITHFLHAVTHLEML
jgi:Rps23 Pro-64 3,4-dihydroxylase Tpa1-like proline 4-hydroxylase